MNRFGAFAIHLGISLIIFLFLGYLILFHWYPDFFFTADGGWQGIRIVAFVDLVLGPVLTLIVYKKGKPSLKFDLTAIALFQAVCLTAGVWVVFSERPLAMVYADGSFQSITGDDYAESEQHIPSFDGVPGPPPYWVSVRLPEDLASQSDIRRQQLVQRRSIKTASEYYVPFAPEHVDLEREGLTPADLDRIGIDVFQAFASQHGQDIDDYVFLPFGTRYEQAVIAMHRTSREVHYLRVAETHVD